MTNNIIEYKGYHAKVEFYASSMTLHGKVIDIDDLVDFEADKLEDVTKEFHSAVDDYIAFCKSVGKNPCKEYKGTFNVRIDPDLQKKISIYAMHHGMTLNSAVGKAIEYFMQVKTSRINFSADNSVNFRIVSENKKVTTAKYDTAVTKPHNHVKNEIDHYA